MMFGAHHFLTGENTVNFSDGHSVDRQNSWAYIEHFPKESAAMVKARASAERLGADPVSASTADLLRLLVAATNAQNVLEVGTGTGVSTLALLEGMTPGSALTTLDIDNARLQAARHNVMETPAGKKHRLRTICGDAVTVLPRLSTGSYDVAFVDAGAQDAELCVYQSLALLKTGGLLILNNALHDGKVALPTHREPATVAYRRILHDIQECIHDVFVSLVHAENGLYLVYKR